MDATGFERWRGAAPGLAVGALGGLLARDLDLPTIISYWGDRTPLVVAAAAAGALLWPTPLRRAAVAVTVSLGLVWCLVTFTPICGWLADGLTRRDPPQSADAVFVLGSRLQKDGDPTTAAMARLQHAFELLGQGRAPRLVVSELPFPPSHAAVARQMMSRLGLEQEVLSVGPVWNTREEAVLVGTLLRERGWSTLLVVTSPTHSRRASAALEREGVHVVSSPCVETEFDLEEMDRADGRLHSFGNILHERIGLWYYARRGWLR